MARDNSSLYVLSIVAVVAVVGLVTLFMGNGEGALSADAGTLVGQVVYDGESIDGEVRIPRVISGEKYKDTPDPFVSREDSRDRQLAAIKVTY